jgi:outer membrane protein assembly factor BamA
MPEPARGEAQSVSCRPSFLVLLACCAARAVTAFPVEDDAVVRDDSLGVLEAGRPARIGGWRILGDSVLAVERLHRSMPGRGTEFNRTAVDRAAAAILSAHENGGYPFCVVTPLALAQESGFVYPAFKVEAGSRVEVGFLEFAGKPGTRPALLERIAGFTRGSYSGAATAIWRQRLEQSGLVVVDSEAIVEAPGPGRVRSSGYGVRFWVTGRRVNSAGGVAGYSPDDRKLTGLLQVSFRNLFDTGRRLAAGWQSAYSRTGYRLSYTEPWILGTAIDVTASARQQTVDTTSGQTNLALSADAPAATWTTVSFETGYDRFTDVLSRTSADVVWAGTGVVLDSRDFPANPRKGVRLTALTSVGNRSVTQSPNAFLSDRCLRGRPRRSSLGLSAADSVRSDVVTHVELGIAGAVPVGRSFAWLNSLGLRAVYSAATLTETELYRLGGPGTVRGYREDEFVSTRLGWFSSELRYRLDHSSSVYPFTDVGVYRDSLDWQVKPGYGIGTKVATRVGVLGFDYGVAFRDSPHRGKVHLSYDLTF